MSDYTRMVAGNKENPQGGGTEAFELLQHLGSGGFAHTFSARVLDADLIEEFQTDIVALKIPINKKKGIQLKKEITLNGASEATVECGGSYTDAGAAATDQCGIDLSASIEVGGDTVDTTIVGMYLITFTVLDSAGNPALQKTRTVHVVDDTPPAITDCASNPGPLSLGEECTVALPDLTTGVTATDNCGTPVVTQSPLAGTDRKSVV